MKNNYLEQALPFLTEIDDDRRIQFEAYFRTAPAWLLDSFSIERMEKGTVFVHEGRPVDTIYFIGKGMIKATDYRIYGIKYDFMLTSKVCAYGGMEIIINLDKYQTTLETVTDCIVLKIPKSTFKRWLHSDIEALKKESQLMGEYLLQEDRERRAFLFLQGANRFAFLLMNRYRQYSENGVLTLKGERQELSDFTGLCVKTISRSVKKLKEAGLITVRGNYIIIDENQYRQLCEMISEVLAEEV